MPPASRPGLLRSPSAISASASSSSNAAARQRPPVEIPQPAPEERRRRPLGSPRARWSGGEREGRRRVVLVAGEEARRLLGTALREAQLRELRERLGMQRRLRARADVERRLQLLLGLSHLPVANRTLP